MTRTFFHCCPADSDPRSILDPDRQFTEPWDGHDHGPCDKCSGVGSTLYVCRSCEEAGASPDCPACRGRVRFKETCPACLGNGEIDHTLRRGVAVFPVRQGLYRYLAERDDELEGKVVIELEGQLGEERDLDADTGALLVLPSAIKAVQPLDLSLIKSIRDRLDQSP
jgi:RecJ-like exonuclease